MSPSAHFPRPSPPGPSCVPPRMGPGSVTAARVASLEQEVANLRRRLDARDEVIARLEARIGSPPPSPGGRSAGSKSLGQGVSAESGPPGGSEQGRVASSNGYAQPPSQTACLPRPCRGPRATLSSPTPPPGTGRKQRDPRTGPGALGVALLGRATSARPSVGPAPGSVDGAQVLRPRAPRRACAQSRRQHACPFRAPNPLLRSPSREQRMRAFAAWSRRRRGWRVEWPRRVGWPPPLTCAPTR